MRSKNRSKVSRPCSHVISCNTGSQVVRYDKAHQRSAKQHGSRYLGLQRIVSRRHLELSCSYAGKHTRPSVQHGPGLLKLFTSQIACPAIASQPLARSACWE